MDEIFRTHKRTHTHIDNMLQTVKKLCFKRVSVKSCTFFFLLDCETECHQIFACPINSSCPEICNGFIRRRKVSAGSCMLTRYHYLVTVNHLYSSSSNSYQAMGYFVTFPKKQGRAQPISYWHLNCKLCTLVGDAAVEYSIATSLFRGLMKVSQ